MSGYLLPDGSPIDLGTPVHYDVHLERGYAPGPYRRKVWHERRNRTATYPSRPETREGIVIGVRTLADGRSKGGYDESLYFIPESYRRVVVVAFAMHRRPDLVPFEAVTLR